jgi:metallo-beta-lactamase family protein
MGEVTFCGACGTVTGSSTLLSWGETRVLVDCGLYQGDDELEQRNWRPFPYAPHDLDAVVLTHAHLDHTGLLPRLVAQGFTGPIYCSRPSRGLISLILRDAGHLQEEQARYARKKGYSRHADPKPLYTDKDAAQALRLVERLSFDDSHEILPGIHVRLRRAGHLLGAASIEIQAKGSDGKRRSWCFSGDVGRYEVPILRDPEPPIDPPDALVLESTYGDRSHRESDPEAAFRDAVRRVFARRGTVVIPAFALGRSQEVLFHLSRLVERGELDPEVVYLDSPMAIAASDLYQQAGEEHDEEFAELVREERSALDPDRFHRCRTVAESKALNDLGHPAVIVAASGMATGGRVVHHLKRLLPDERNAVIFVGYQAGGTRGRALVDGARHVAIHGDAIPVRAEISVLHGLSAHGDREDLARWCHALPHSERGRPQRIFLNHGEDPARKSLAATLSGEGFVRPALPLTGDTVPW